MIIKTFYFRNITNFQKCQSETDSVLFRSEETEDIIEKVIKDFKEEQKCYYEINRSIQVSTSSKDGVLITDIIVTSSFE